MNLAKKIAFLIRFKHVRYYLHKTYARGIVIQNDLPKRFKGVILKVESSYAFLVRDEIQDVIFAHSKYSDFVEWEKLRYNKRVTFDLFFNYRGPTAKNVLLE